MVGVATAPVVAIWPMMRKGVSKIVANRIYSRSLAQALGLW